MRHVTSQALLEGTVWPLPVATTIERYKLVWVERRDQNLLIILCVLITPAKN